MKRMRILAIAILGIGIFLSYKFYLLREQLNTVPLELSIDLKKNAPTNKNFTIAHAGKYKIILRLSVPPSIDLDIKCWSKKGFSILDEELRKYCCDGSKDYICKRVRGNNSGFDFHWNLSQNGLPLKQGSLAPSDGPSSIYHDSSIGIFLENFDGLEKMTYSFELTSNEEFSSRQSMNPIIQIVRDSTTENVILVQILPIISSALIVISLILGGLSLKN